MARGEQVIKNTWTESNGGMDTLEDLHKRLKQCSIQLGRWSAHYKKDANKEIEERSNVLKEIQHKEGPSDGALIRKLDKEIAKLLKLEDIKWRQGVKRNWYSLGTKTPSIFMLEPQKGKRKTKLSRCLIKIIG